MVVALNCRPCSRSMIQDPVALMNSPALMAAACPITATRSRWAHALTRSMQSRSRCVGYMLHQPE